MRVAQVSGHGLPLLAGLWHAGCRAHLPHSNNHLQPPCPPGQRGTSVLHRYHQPSPVSWSLVTLEEVTVNTGALNGSLQPHPP